MIPSILTPEEPEPRTEAPSQAQAARDSATQPIRLRASETAGPVPLSPDLPPPTLTPTPTSTALPIRAHRLLATLAAARNRRKGAPVKSRAEQVAHTLEILAARRGTPPHTAASAPALLFTSNRQHPRQDRDLECQIQGIRDFIGRLECEIATRHGLRAERAITLKTLRREVADIEIALDEASGAHWINLIEQYNTAKTRLTQLAEIDKRQTAIDISDDPHMEAELQKWRLRLARVTHPERRLH